MSLIFRSYRTGLSGFHSFGAVIPIVTGMPASPEAVPIIVPSRETVTSASEGAISMGGHPSGPWQRSSSTVTDSLPLSISGIIRRSLIHEMPAGSSHTLCHIPVEGVYHIPPGLVTCFPLGCLPLSVGSVTLTTILCLLVSERNGEILHVKGS